MAQTNLPVQLTSFIGRKRELAEVERLINTSRLITLTGAGGCGKTRLALRVAENVSDSFQDGVWWMELAVLNDPNLLAQAVLQTLGLPESTTRTPLELLTDYFRPKDSLLILDNCEHLIDACARFVSLLLQTCSQLSILVTSREALNIDGELAWIVPSLQIPSTQSSSLLSDLEQYDAVKLFIARASTIMPDFTLTKQNADTIVKICQQLDGIPLAIELAAARIKVLQLEQIAERLDNTLQLLTQGKRMAPSRHQTLRATMDWSYHLLSEAEQKLFQRLAVFSGGFTLEAVEAVCAGSGVEPEDILELIARLVSKSLLIVVEQNAKSQGSTLGSVRYPTGGSLRYRFLEPVRQYAHEKLVASNEENSVRNHHLSYFHHWTETTETRLYTAEQLIQLADLDRDLDNIRAALQWAIQTQPVTALHMVAALTLFWNIRGYTTEGRQWGEQALWQTEGNVAFEVQDAKARVLTTVAFLTMTQGDYPAASAMISQAIPILRSQNDEAGLARALFVQSTVMSFLGQPSIVREAAEESLKMGIQVGDPFTLSILAPIMAGSLFRVGEIAIAERFVEEALTNGRKLGSPMALAFSLWGAGMGAFTKGNLKVASQQVQESLALFRQVGDKHRINMVASGLAQIWYEMGNMREAEKLYVESMRGWWNYGQMGGIARCIECLAFIAITEQRDQQAARWLGAAENIRQGSHAERLPPEEEEFEREIVILRGRINPQDFNSSWSEGQALTLQQVIAEVDQLLVTPQVKRRDPYALTLRELDVLRLLVQGLSDTQIAEKLVVSRRTVTTHLTTIYSKLGVNSRSAAIRYALDHELS